MHDGNPGDVAFYVSCCRPARSVLELGCGTGRIGAALTASGHEVVGIDIDAAALPAAAARGVVTHLADMRDFDLGRRFERVLIPYNGLYCLLTEADVVRCLSAARRHLSPGGLLVFDVYSGDALDEERVTEVNRAGLEPIGTVRVGVDTWEVFEGTDWRPSQQRLTARYRHVRIRDGHSVHAAIEQRYLYSHELPELLSRAGLTLAALSGGFERQPFDVFSPLMVVRAERARP